MTAELLIRNAAVFSLQIAALIAVAAVLMAALRIRSPQPRVRIWHALLAGCLLMPALTRWQSEPPATDGTVSATSAAAGVIRTNDDSARKLSWPFSVAESLLLLLGTGFAVRVAMLLIAVRRLRAMSRRARLVWPIPDSIERAQQAAGAHPMFCWSDEVAGPVTFGYRQPVVLLPARFTELTPAEQTSVALHEALHVRRCDWLYTAAEEVIRALLWFHPAIWFALNRIQLAREQAVDQMVVRAMRGSDEYVDALLKIAAAQIEPDLAPAPLFLKKQHLRERVITIVKGANMSAKRLAISILTLIVALPTTAFVIATYLPLRAAAQSTPADSAGVEVKTGPFKVLHRTAVQYPIEARDTGQEGTVIVGVTLDRNGEVTDARVVSSTGPDSLRRAALSSVLGWHFSTEPVEIAPGNRRPTPSSFEIAIGFHPSQAPTPGPADPAAVAAAPNWTIDKLDLSRVPDELRSKVEEAITLREGQPIRQQDIEQQRANVRKVDSHLTLAAGRRGPDPNKVTLTVLVRTPPVSTEGMVPSPSTPATPERIRVGGNVQAVNLIDKVTPLYPPDAKAARIQGVVKFQAIIGKDGHIVDLQLLSGHPLLAQSAMDAVRQWVYKPTLLNGNPVEVVTQIDVNYTLAP